MQMTVTVKLASTLLSPASSLPGLALLAVSVYAVLLLVHGLVRFRLFWCACVFRLCAFSCFKFCLY